MKHTQLIAVSTVVLAAVAQVPAAERPPLDQSDIAITTPDFQAQFHTSSHGSTREGIYGTLLNEKGTTNLMHRILMDKERGLYYGYDVAIDKASGGFDVKVAPLGPEADRYFAETRWKELCPTCAAPRRVDAAQRFPAPRRIRAGDTISVDLLEDARGGIVSDEIKVSTSPVDTASDNPFFPPVDLKPEEVLLQMAQPRLFVNGEPSAQPYGGSVQGQVVWVDLPDHGRLHFTLGPRAGCALSRVGVLAGDKITFSVDGTRYEWVSNGPIATAPPIEPFKRVQSWNLWGYHDRESKPFQQQYGMGASGGCPVPAGKPSRS